MSYQLAAADPRGLDPDRVEEASNGAFDAMVGESDALRRAVAMARRAAERRAPTILLCGETGTGKELFARGIHYAGPEPDAPFVAVNCPAIPAQLLESELFGYERGAFTGAAARKQGLFEVARGGTLFLDEISSLPPDLQPKLLRVLEERRVRRVGGVDEAAVRCRVVAATNEPLEEAVADGRFREDLFYRLNVMRLTIPPLREREGDVALLARHFVEEATRVQGLPRASLTNEILSLLEGHAWPGNVRELKNVIDRAVTLSDDGRLRPEHVTTHASGRGAPLSDDASFASIAIPPVGRSLESVENELVRVTLALTGGNKSAAARILGISRPTMARKAERCALAETD